VGSRIEQELLARASHLLLGATALVQLRPYVARSRGERVANRLELLDTEQSGAASPRRRCRHGRPQSSELLVEPRDLLAERPPRRPVVDDERVENGRLFQDHCHPPMGAFGLKPQNTCVPSIPIRCTPTVLNTIDFAVAVPTPTGPPPAV
jgi:hypothetical protein